MDGWLGFNGTEVEVEFSSALPLDCTSPAQYGNWNCNMCQACHVIGWMAGWLGFYGILSTHDPCGSNDYVNMTEKSQCQKAC